MKQNQNHAKRYHRIKLLLSLVSSLLFLLYAAVWVLSSDGSFLLGTDHRWWGLILYAMCFGLGFELITLPLGYYEDFILEHRFELSHQTPGRWLRQLVCGWMVGGLLGGILLLSLYALLWYGGSYWWLWVWIGWLVLSVILVQLFPKLLLPIFYKSHTLENPSLQNRLESLACGSGLRVEGIYELKLSDDTRSANAMLTGIGHSRRVYLSDTLLASFEPDEIEVVFAHELGHHTRNHIWKLLSLSALVSTLHIGILLWVLDPAQHWRDTILQIPIISLYLSAAMLIIQPIHNAVSRRFERQCDKDALHRTQNPQAYRSAFRRLGELNLADPEPHPFIEWYFHDHPALAKRIAMADQFNGSSDPVDKE